MAKYSIGDWVYDNRISDDDYFWKIKDISKSKLDGETAYGVIFMIDTQKSLDFHHWGDLFYVGEHVLRPVTDVADLLRCKLSDAQHAYLKAQREADKCKADVDALLCSQQLLRGA